MAHALEGSSPALRFDIVAGLTAAAVVLPKAMAYAAVAGLPVSVGLCTAVVPMIVYALLGTSRVLSVSSTTTLAILNGTQLALADPDGDPGIAPACTGGNRDRLLGRTNQAGRVRVHPQGPANRVSMGAGGLAWR